MQIVVFGDLLYDCFIWADRLPRTGETVTGYASGFFASGKGGNQAATCARLGAHTTMLGKVGADERGRFLLDTLRENGVITQSVIVDSAQATGTDCVLVGKDGNNAIVVAPNANAAISLQEVDSLRPAFESAQIALFQLQVNTDAVHHAMRLARACGTKIVLNPAPACAVEDELFALADYVTPNETEAEFFTGVYREGKTLYEWCAAAAKSLRGRGAKCVVITLGEHGAYCLGPDGEMRLPAFDVEAIDSTAAGEAFNAGLAVRLAAGDGLQDAIRYANACGAITASRRGSMPSLPSRQEVEAFLEARKGEALPCA